MGAQTPDRLKQFQKRYNDWDDPQGLGFTLHFCDDLKQMFSCSVTE